MKIDATCCDAEVRYPTDSNLLEDGSRLIDRLLDEFCARHKVKKPQTHRTEARQAFIGLIKKNQHLPAAFPFHCQGQGEGHG